ncbi:hypothetical protein PC110_g11015 [Phytophthora cactorum]|uniref:PiggyBac transposable element-derived protein domain-containing protein n=1 Tax=Phytophthora cactorum TaxID=29920 RepID=A0A329S7E8_9STRA|nr:hypothetical protein PC111_g879 [Phytophthora cactorum]KAG2861386.1 hypothetical protein PC113_g7225 [Phytophthora cactorum]KAG2930953.1 hypothetical protein PC115_g6252 [Phytophthora cactorum]KAG2946846.1 hypothetical protein PC117_g7310 [Phytophthora cactorum]KAG3092546.1 hypothetical protein PC122_g6517 [Phytophthora cactorum]
MPGNQSGLRRVWSHDEAEKYDMDAGEQDSDESVEAHCAPEDAPDDPEETETEVAVEVVFAEDVLESFRGTDEVLAGCLESSVLLGMTATGWEDEVEPDMHEYMSEPTTIRAAYPGLRQGYCGPTADALRYGDSPVVLFFYFLPVVLWQHIAVCSNEYHREVLLLRIEATYQRYRKKQRRNPELPRRTRRGIQNELHTKKPIMPHELCGFIGLLVARTFAPNREKLSSH